MAFLVKVDQYSSPILEVDVKADLQTRPLPKEVFRADREQLWTAWNRLTDTKSKWKSKSNNRTKQVYSTNFKSYRNEFE